MFRDPELEAAFTEHGFVVVPLLGPDAVDALREAHHRLHDGGGRGFVPDYFLDDPTLKRDVDRVVRPVVAPHLERLLAEHEPFMTSYLMKWPGEDSALGLHRDWSYVDERQHRTAVVWIALDDASDEIGNGPLRVVPGSHKVVPRFRGTFTEDPFGDHHALILRRFLTAVPVRAGEAVVVDNRVLHASFPNRSDRPRLAVAAAVRPVGSTLLHPVQRDHRIDLHEVDEEFFYEHTPETLKAAGGPPHPVREQVPIPDDALDVQALADAAGIDLGEVAPSAADATTQAPPPHRSLSHELRHAVVRRSLSLDAALVQRSVGAGTPFLAPDGVPWVEGLEASYPTIRAEVDALLATGIRLPRMTDVLGVDQGDDGRWHTLVLVAQGRPVRANLLRLPETAEAIAAVPGLQSALLSVFPAGMHLPAHRAPNKGVLRYHLGLRVPEPPGSCQLRVGEETVPYREGRSILFDDTFEHEAWNDAAEERVTLLLEVLRPLPRGVAQLNRLLQGLYGRASSEAAGAVRRAEELDVALNGRLNR